MSFCTETFLHAIGMSYINFSSIIISTFSKKYFGKLENYYLQSGAILFNMHRNALTNADWKPLSDILLLKRFIMLHKIIIGDHVPSLKNCLTVRHINYCLRNTSQFAILRFNKSYCSKGFYIWGARFWRAIPSSIREITCLTTFTHEIEKWINSAQFNLTLF